MTELVHELIFEAAQRDPRAPALRYAGGQLDYGVLARLAGAAGGALRALGCRRGDRVAVWCPKREETVCALFGAAAAGCAFVALDPAATPAQAAAILFDSGARVLVTTGERLTNLGPALRSCPELSHAVVCAEPAPQVDGLQVLRWSELLAMGVGITGHRCIDTDVAALQYTHANGARPRALVLSHRNLVAAARSMARRLVLTPRDRLLAALPLSDDFGFNQLTSAFSCGASAVLLNPLLTRDVADTAVREGITCLAAHSALLTELAALAWPAKDSSLRHVVCACGTLPGVALDALRRALPHVRIHQMTGVPEAFRMAGLADDEMDAHPGSAGRPLPHAELLVLRPDGAECAPGEEGELVQRGPLVAHGYWNDGPRTSDSFRALPARAGVPLPEIALWTGETARIGEDGHLYLLRQDAVIRTSGFRVRPAVVEEVVYGTGLVEEAAAVGVAHPALGQVIAVLATARPGARLDSAMLFGACRAHLPGHMVPTMVDVRRAPLPRGLDGRIDRERLAGELAPLFAEAAS